MFFFSLFGILTYSQGTLGVSVSARIEVGSSWTMRPNISCQRCCVDFLVIPSGTTRPLKIKRLFPFPQKSTEHIFHHMTAIFLSCAAKLPHIWPLIQYWIWNLIWVLSSDTHTYNQAVALTDRFLLLPRELSLSACQFCFSSFEILERGNRCFDFWRVLFFEDTH